MSKRSLKKVSSLVVVAMFILLLGKVLRINDCIEGGGKWDKGVCHHQVAKE